MSNRIKELEKDFPKTKEAFDQFINTIASHRNVAIDDLIAKHINKLSKKLDDDLRDEY